MTMPSRAELSTLVRTKVAEVLGTPVEEIDESTNLEVGYQIDSLELMEIGARLEAALGIRLDLRELIGVETVGQATDLLTRRLEAQP
ncbi:acyl carrier protein [Micromonospora sp. C95]|uniref:acyl carrier protein n=1 Tax=Micromonospora sp. C95 TaxID=2824882 RepID=UPI001B36A94F|nr:acyl carrier protein [Micromonospora sp. C95]MBQ1026027.1 acyl carrier protein [Micromonospora sp. C95]